MSVGQSAHLGHFSAALHTWVSQFSSGWAIWVGPWWIGSGFERRWPSFSTRCQNRSSFRRTASRGFPLPSRCQERLAAGLASGVRDIGGNFLDSSRVFQMSNNGYSARLSWPCSPVLGLVLPSSGAVSPAMESPLASAPPSRSMTSSPTASRASFCRLRTAFSLRS